MGERFTARNAQGPGQTQARLDEDALGGPHWSGGAADFTLEDGSPVERNDESTFRVASTGEILRREEGLHVVMHHPDQLTPAGTGMPGRAGNKK